MKISEKEIKSKMRNWLTALRKARGMTQAKLAKAAGISQNYLSAIEVGQRNVPVSTAKRIASALGFDWQRFYEDENEKEKSK